MPGIDLNTKFISHWDGNNGAKEIVDDGDIGFISTLIGTAQLDTSTKQFGSASLFTDGNSDNVTIGDNTDFKFLHGADDISGFKFTIDFWINDTSGVINVIPFTTSGVASGTIGAQVILNSDKSITGIIYFGVGGQNVIIVNSSAGAISSGTSTHFAWTHDQSLVLNNSIIYINGVQDGIATKSGNTPSTSNSNNPLLLGRVDAGLFFSGHLDEVRVSDIIRYTGNFTPETNEYISDINTRLLLHCNSHDISGDSGFGLYHIPTFIATAQLDTSIKKFDSASILLDGNSDGIIIPDSVDWDLIGSNLDDWTLDTHIRHTTTGLIETYISQFEDINNYWALFKNTSDELEFIVVSGGATIINLNGGSISSGSFIHIALAKVADEYGLYISGTQVAYVQDTSTDTFSGSLRMGSLDNSSDFLGGHIDESRIQNSNDFSASPNVGLTDTITVPTQEYTVSIPSVTLNLIATAISGTQIDLSWTAPVNPGDSAIIGYQIERESPEGGGFSIIVADTGNTNTTFSDLGRSAFTEYNYRVSAINTQGIGLASNEAKDTTLGAPGQPINLFSNIISDVEVVLSWNAPLDDGGFAITGYKIERKNRQDISFTTIVADTGNTNTSFDDMNFIQTSKLIYRVSAINSVATGDPSAEHTTGTIIFSIDSPTDLLLHMDDNTFIDTSGDNHTAIKVGGAGVESVSPKLGAANYLNTGSGQLRYANSENLFPGATTKFTIDFWFKPPTSTMFDLKLCVYGQQLSVAQSAFFFQIQGTELQFFRNIAAGNETKILSAFLSWDTSTWYHVVVERRGANGYTMYRDGKIVDTSSDNASIFNPSGGELSVAGHGFGGTFDVRMDEFRYSRGVARYDGEEFCPPVNAYGTQIVGGQDIRFNPFFRIHENVDTSENLTFNKFTGRHYKNYKRE